MSSAARHTMILPQQTVTSISATILLSCRMFFSLKENIGAIVDMA